MTPEQQELIPFYHLRYSTGETFTLQPVADYVLSRYGKSGRATFQGRGINLTLDKRERELFLRYVKRHNLRENVVLDDGRKEKPCM